MHHPITFTISPLAIILVIPAILAALVLTHKIFARNSASAAQIVSLEQTLWLPYQSSVTFP